MHTSGVTPPIAEVICMCQKCGGDCGLLVLYEIIKEKYPKNMKKIVGAVWELPAK